MLHWEGKGGLELLERLMEELGNDKGEGWWSSASLTIREAA